MIASLARMPAVTKHGEPQVYDMTNKPGLSLPVFYGSGLSLIPALDLGGRVYYQVLASRFQCF